MSVEITQKNKIKISLASFQCFVLFYIYLRPSSVLFYNFCSRDFVSWGKYIICLPKKNTWNILTSCTHCRIMQRHSCFERHLEACSFGILNTRGNKKIRIERWFIYFNGIEKKLTLLQVSVVWSKSVLAFWKRKTETPN